MSIPANSTSYRVTVTDSASGKKRKLNFPISGTVKEKRQQVREIKNYITQCKLEAKKLETRALIMEAAACRRKSHQDRLNIILNVAKLRSNRQHNRVVTLLERYKKTNIFLALSAKSQYQYELRVTKFLNYLKIKDIIDVVQITKEHAEEFMIELKCKNSTYNKYLAVMSSFFKGLNMKNPFKEIKRKNAEEDATAKIPFTEEEVNLILNSFKDDWQEICLIAAYTGMRFGDVIHLRKENITFDLHQKQHIIQLTPAKTKHTGRSLYIQLLPPLEFLLEKAANENGYFFPDKVKKYKASTAHAGASLNHVFVKKLRSLGINNKSFHCFRHYFVDKLRKAGFSNEQIGSVIGHASIKQTRDYGDYHNPLNLEKIM
ncbi:MAG: tyrosine-type recombinase/integrase [Lentisphaerae bacterium]|nr:tyrosine-type recombinase/integrase [Lentisphaerota bacterium]